MKFRIEITETLQKVVEIEANDAVTAECMVRDMYRSGDLVLTAGDHVATEFTVQ